MRLRSRRVQFCGGGLATRQVGTRTVKIGHIPNRTSGVGDGQRNGEAATAFEIFGLILITGFTVGLAVLLWVSNEVAEVAKDAFEPFPISELPIPERITHSILFGSIGFAASTSFFMLTGDFLNSRALGRLAFFARNRLLLFIFVAASYMVTSIIWHAFCE